MDIKSNSEFISNRKARNLINSNKSFGIKNNFFKSKKIKKIIIPSKIKVIGSNSFAKVNLKKLKLNKGLIIIEERAFAHNKLKSIVIPNNVTSIGQRAFESNQLTEVKLSENLKIIREGMFAYNRLVDITIPDSVTVIEGSAFVCNNLEKIKLSDNLIIIGKNAFENNSLKVVILPDKLKNIGEYAFFANSLKSLVIPNSVKTIGESAFESNQLIEVKLSENLKIIRESTFSGNKLVSIIIPDSVEIIETNAFSENCLKTVILSSNLKSIGESAFRKNKIEELIVPDSVEIISENAFRNNELTKVKLSSNLMKIGENAFSENSITSLVIPDKIKVIERETFKNNSLSLLELSKNLEIIKARAFQENLLTSITIPNSVKEIEISAFEKNSLSYLKLSKNLKKIEAFAFKDNNLVNVEIPNKIKIIETGTFMNNKLKNVIIPDGVEKIENTAFLNNQLTRVVIPDSVTKIGYNAFDNDVILKNNYVLMDIVNIFNKINRTKIVDIEEFYNQNKDIQYLCSNLLKYKLNFSNGKYKKVLDKIEKIYHKTRLEYLPPYEMLKKVDDEFIEKFDLKVWKTLINNNILTSTPEMQDSLLEIIKIFGLFENDKNKYNRLAQVKKIIENRDYSLTKEQYLRIDDKHKWYFEDDIRKEIRLKSGCNIPDEYSFYLKDLITPSRYKYIKNLSGSSGAIINKLLSELYEEVDSIYYIPVVDSEKIEKYIDEQDILGKINIESLHRMFPGDSDWGLTEDSTYIFNEEIYQFLIKYFDIILEDEILQSLVPTIIEKFSKIKEEYNIDTNDIPSLKQCFDYCRDNEFNYTFGNKELAKMANMAGVSSDEAYEYYQELNKSVQERKSSVLIRSDDVYNYKGITLRCRLLRCDDPFNMFVGETNYTNCCQSYNRAGEDCMKHASISIDGGIFEISYLKDGHWIQLCQSWDWQNEGVYCHDNIEATRELKNHPELNEAIIYVYKENANKIINESSFRIDKYIEERLKKLEKIKISPAEKEFEINRLNEIKLRQKIKIVTVGAGFSDIELSNYFNDKINVIRNPKNYFGYSDAKDKQYIIAGSERELIPEKSDYEQIPIYRDDRRIFKEHGENINQSTLKLMYDIENCTYPKEMINYSDNDKPLITTPSKLADICDNYTDELRVIYGEDWYLLYGIDSYRDSIMVHDLAKASPRLSDEKLLQTTEINEVLKLLMDESIKVDKSLEADLKEDTSYLIYLMYLKSGLIKQLGDDLEYSFSDKRNTKKVSFEEQLNKLRNISKIRKDGNPEMIMHKVKFRPTEKYIDYYYSKSKMRVISK